MLSQCHGFNTDVAFKIHVLFFVFFCFVIIFIFLLFVGFFIFYVYIFLFPAIS